MEGLLSLCIVTLSTLLILLFFNLSGRKNKPKKQQLPPGPWTLPVIGSIHHLIGAVPHRAMRDLSRQHGPLMLLRLGEVPTVVVSSAEVAALVLKTNDLAFASRPSGVSLDIFGCGGKDIFFAPYGDHWRQIRRICVMELLSARKVNRMESIRAEEVGKLLGYITDLSGSGASSINVSKKAVALSIDIMSRAVFGGKFTRQEEYIHGMGEILPLLGGLCLADLFPSSRLVRWMSNGERHLKRCCGRVQHIIADIIEGRKDLRRSSNDDEDLLDVLLRLRDEDSLEFPLTSENVGAILFDIFAAATESTGSVLAWAMSELILSPETMAKAQHEVREVLGENRAVITSCNLAELHYMRMIIKEVLRLHPPAPFVPRRTREDCTIMCYEIPKDTNVLINLWAISKDPAHWNNPEEFKPERFQNSNVNYNGTYFDFIPFGAGCRQCPGIQYSSAVLEMTLANFLYHFDWMLPDGASLASFDMSERSGLAVSRRSDLQLRATPHVWLGAMPSN